MTHLTHTTKSISEKNIERSWHLIDARNQILGRMSTAVAKLLTGKHKTTFVPYLDSGDNVVIINAAAVKLTGRKEQNKTYNRYSGYPGGLKEISFSEMKLRRPSEIIRHSVMGMLPKNKLRDRMITRLFIYQDEKHPYEGKFKTESEK